MIETESEVSAMWDHDGGWWILMSVWMVVFWGLLIVGAIILVNWLGENKRTRESPEETLRRRLASGEIDEERYRALLDELAGRPHGPAAAAH